MLEHVENREQLPHARKRHLLRLARPHKPIVELMQDMVVAHPHEGAMYSAARTCARPPQHLREELATVPVERCESPRPLGGRESRPACHQAPPARCRARSAAASPAPATPPANAASGRCRGLELLFQDGQDAVDGAGRRGARVAALQLGRPHLNDLSAASRGLPVRGRQQGPTAALRHRSPHRSGRSRSVDAVCLRQLALRAGEVTNLTGVDHRRNTGGAERDGQGHP